MEMMIVRQPVSPEKMTRLEKASSFRQRHSNLFPSLNSWRHFVRSRWDELLRRGLLVELTGGHYVDRHGLEAALPELLASRRSPTDA